MKIHILDDEPRLCEELTDYLETRGHTVTAAQLPSQSLPLLHADAYDLLILDLKLPESDGLTLLKSFYREGEAFDTIMISGHGDMDSVIEALRLGAIDYIRKPFTPQEIAATLSRAERVHQRNVGIRRRKPSKHPIEAEPRTELIGTSAAMERLRRIITVTSATCDSTVLITGESGTGKEVVARAIHRSSPRADGSFVAVNCSAIPHELFESEFFGHRKGAFTGATSNRVGYFRAAHGGTLFLDEVGELPLPMQAKLLRVLEEHRVRPVGSEREHSVDTRVIAATNDELEPAVHAHRFRLDLFYRLNTIRISVPPLREHPEDIPALTKTFTQTFSRRMGRPPLTIPPGTMEQLSTLPFPGNVRELRNIVERAMIFDDPRMLLECGTQPNATIHESSHPQTLRLETLERRAIIEAIQRSSGVIAHAARTLGISRQALLRRMEKYGITTR